MGNFEIDKNYYHFQLVEKFGNTVVGYAYFSTYGEAEGFARHNGYHKYDKKKIEKDCDYKNYEIVDLKKC